MSDPTPESLATLRRGQLLAMSEQEFRLWQHSPATAAFLQYLDDQIAAFRDLAADLVEAGAFSPGARAELQNPDVVRGQILATKMLRGISLADIQGFYGQEAVEQTQPQTGDA